MKHGKKYSESAKLIETSKQRGKATALVIPRQNHTGVLPQRSLVNGDMVARSRTLHRNGCRYAALHKVAYTARPMLHSQVGS